MRNQDSLTKAARIAYIVLLLRSRGSKPPKRGWDTRKLAGRLGVTQRSIQRDVHYARRVLDILRTYSRSPKK